MLYFEHYDEVVTEEELINAKLSEELLVEMANLSPKVTKLPYKIWIDQLGVRRDVAHNYTPRIKVCVNGNWIPMEVSDTPDIPQSVKDRGTKSYPKIELIKNWVKAYKNVLEAHFFGKIDDNTAINLLRDIKYAEAADLTLDQILQVPRKIVFYWDKDELLYYIEVREGDEVIDTHFVLDEYKLIPKLSMLQHQYNIDKIEQIER